MSRTQGFVTGIAMALGVMLVSSPGESGARLQWESGGGAVSWHRNCAFSHPAPEPGNVEAHRFLTLRGSLITLSRNDAALYAVYLQDSHDLDRLDALLAEAGGPPAWNADPAPAGREFSTEWITMDPNGGLTVRVDEAKHPGKSLVAVVNRAGEILGVHGLWTHHGEIAALESR